MDRNITIEAVRLTEAAALYASRYMGKGDEEKPYQSAADAMIKVLSSMDINGEIIIGAKSKESILGDGDVVGKEDGIPLDIAVKPLDGKRTCARGGNNSISYIAVGEKGAFLSTPTVMMEKIAVGKEAKGVVDINQPADINIKRVARTKNKYIDDLTVCVLDRDHNAKLVQDIRKTGAKILFITDGDISGAISTALEDNSIDILMGIGGAKEGTLAAAALKCLDGDIQTRFIYQNKTERKMIEEATGEVADKIYTINDMVRTEDVIVSITGVTDGVLLPGVRYFHGGAETSSILLRHKTRTMRIIKALHQFDFKPIF